MRAGSLTERVTLERFTMGQDEIGQPVEEWTPYATVWAAVEPLNGRDLIAAQPIRAEVTTCIRMRYRPGVSPADRIDHGGTIYNISTAINPKSRDAELVLMCKALTN